MPTTEMVGFVAVIAALVLGFISVLRLIATMIMHRTIRRVVEKSPELAEGMLDRLTGRQEASGEDRLAIILIAIGIAMIGGTLIAVDDPGLIRAAVGASLFPLLIGGGLWLRFRAAKRAGQRAGAE